MIDQRLLEQYAELMGTAGVTDIVDTFADNIGGYLDHLQWLVKQRQEAEVRRQAHKLKGACRSVGLTELADAMAALEQQPWQWSELETALQQWSKQLPAHQRALQDWLLTRRVE